MPRLTQSTTEAGLFAGGDLPGKVIALRHRLHQKAVAEPDFRFYSLYGLISRSDVLEAAWLRVKTNRGAAGIDGVTIEAVEKEGVEAFLSQLEEELKQKRYNAAPVRRVYLEKAGGGRRPLGIPTVRDRVVQTAVLLVLEPIFEADFLDSSYGFRLGRSAHDALKKLRSYFKAGYSEIYDADLENFFETIDHERLMKCLQKRVVDRSVLRLIRLWLEAPVIEPDDTGASPKRRRGTPQGGVISPLLANLYLHWFDVVFWRDAATVFRAKLIRYADDFVIVARRIGPELEAWVASTLEGWMGLRLNRQKTRMLKLEQEPLDFLGYRFGYERDRYGGRYVRMRPSPRSKERLRQVLNWLTASRQCLRPVPEVIASMNRRLIGWANYFSLGYPGGDYRQMNAYAEWRLYLHLNRRSQRGWRMPEGSFTRYVRRLGLVRLKAF